MMMMMRLFDMALPSNADQDTYRVVVLLSNLEVVSILRPRYFWLGPQVLEMVFASPMVVDVMEMTTRSYRAKACRLDP